MKHTAKIKSDKIVIKLGFGDDFREKLAAIQALPDRRWNADRKLWIVPANLVGAVEEIIGQEVEGKTTLKKAEAQDESRKAEIVASLAGSKLFRYQKEGVAYLCSRQRSLLADDMGCIDGQAIVKLNRCRRGFEMSIEQLYKKFNNIEPGWDLSFETKVRCLDEKTGMIRLNKIERVIFSGLKNVVEVKTESGKCIKLTVDHMLLSDGQWVEASKLRVGSAISTNGMNVCKECGSTVDVITYKYSKFLGYCKKCMYGKMRRNRFDHTHKQRLGEDGYVYLTGTDYHSHPRYYSSGVLEHILVMEKHIGRMISRDEEIHHINGNRSDNRIENLRLCTRGEHKRIHATEQHFGNFVHKSGKEVVTIPKKEKIVSIKKIKGKIPVYDLVMSDPNRNFIANKIIVHNCGKTNQVITATKLQPQRFPALVVCPASLKLNWQREWMKWADLPAAIVSGKEWKVTEKADVVIINYDILGKHIANIKAFQFNTLIIDESHYVKNTKTNRYKAVKACAAGIPYFVAMSGTPIENRPSEFFSTLNLIDPDRFGSFWRFAQRYCDAKHNGYGWDFSGSSNPDELHELLNGNVMLRRKKEDVLTELPPKQRFSVPFDLPHPIMMPNNMSCAPAIEQLNWLKQATARAKIEQAIEWLENMIESGNKIIAFAIHHEIVDAVIKHFEDVAVKLDGRDSQDQRNAAVDRFQNDETIRLFVGNIQAAGVGITLTKATHVAFLELDWKPGSHIQAEDRAHRIGQQESVTCWYLIAADTIEEDIFDMLYKKKQVIDAVLDGGVSENESIIGALAKKYCGGKK